MKAELDSVNMMRHVTMYVRVKRGTELKWRTWLGTKLIMLAAVLMNCNIEFEASK